MYIETKIVIRENRFVKVRIKSLNWQATVYGLVVDGEIKTTSSEQLIREMYNNF